MTEEQGDQVITLLTQIELDNSEIISQLNLLNSRLDDTSYVTTYAFSGTGYAGDWRMRREVTTGDISWLVTFLPLAAIFLFALLLRALRGQSL